MRSLLYCILLDNMTVPIKISPLVRTALEPLLMAIFLDYGSLLRFIVI